MLTLEVDEFNQKERAEQFKILQLSLHDEQVDNGIMNFFVQPQKIWKMEKFV
jgi:hypothetical protein